MWCVRQRLGSGLNGGDGSPVNAGSEWHPPHLCSFWLEGNVRAGSIHDHMSLGHLRARLSVTPSGMQHGNPPPWALSAETAPHSKQDNPTHPLSTELQTSTHTHPFISHFKPCDDRCPGPTHPTSPRPCARRRVPAPPSPPSRTPTPPLRAHPACCSLSPPRNSTSSSSTTTSSAAPTAPRPTPPHTPRRPSSHPRRRTCRPPATPGPRRQAPWGARRSLRRPRVSPQPRRRPATATLRRPCST